MASKLWTEEEINFLKENYFRDKDFLVEKLNRSYSAIRSKKFNLRLTNNNKWTKEEEQF